MCKDVNVIVGESCNLVIWCVVFGIQTMDVLEEKENVLHKKILLETERAKEFSKAKNKQGIFKWLGVFFFIG